MADSEYKVKAWIVGGTPEPGMEKIRAEVEQLLNEGWLPTSQFPFLHAPIMRSPIDKGGAEISVVIYCFGRDKKLPQPRPGSN